MSQPCTELRAWPSHSTARQGFLLITAKYHGRQPINIDLLSTPIMNTVTLKKSQYQYNSLLEYFNSAQSAVLLIQEFMIQIIIDCVFASECEIMDNLKAVYEYCIPNWPAEYCQYEYLNVASLCFSSLKRCWFKKSDLFNWERWEECREHFMKDPVPS